MTTEALREAIRKTLRETIPENDNGGGEAVRVEHSGTVTIRIEIADSRQAEAGLSLPEECGLRVVSSDRVKQLLDELDSFMPAGRTFEREPKRLVVRPTPHQRALAGGRALR